MGDKACRGNPFMIEMIPAPSGVRLLDQQDSACPTKLPGFLTQGHAKDKVDSTGVFNATYQVSKPSELRAFNALRLF